MSQIKVLNQNKPPNNDPPCIQLLQCERESFYNYAMDGLLVNNLIIQFVKFLISKLKKPTGLISSFIVVMLFIAFYFVKPEIEKMHNNFVSMIDDIRWLAERTRREPAGKSKKACEKCKDDLLEVKLYMNPK